MCENGKFYVGLLYFSLVHLCAFPSTPIAILGGLQGQKKHHSWLWFSGKPPSLAGRSYPSPPSPIVPAYTPVCIDDNSARKQLSLTTTSSQHLALTVASQYPVNLILRTQLIFFFVQFVPLLVWEGTVSIIKAVEAKAYKAVSPIISQSSTSL